MLLRLGGDSSSPQDSSEATASGSTKALEHLSAACAANPKSVKALLGWASVTQDAKQPDAALLRYRAAIAQVLNCCQHFFPLNGGANCTS
jgi:lipopolysaccharide biosynthesis regulator YciM